MNITFKFVNEKLNHSLILLLKKAKLKFKISAQNLIHYATQDEERIENEIICKIRDKAFPTWQLLSCPAEAAPLYKQYMVSHQIPYEIELCDSEIGFLLPRSYRPHAWKLELERMAS